MVKRLLSESLYYTTPIGLWFLAVFCFKENIPFPLELSVLPSLAMALGIICALITVIFISYAMISTLVLVDPLDIGYKNIVYPNEGGFKGNWKKFLLKYFLVYVLPVFYILYHVYCKEAESAQGGFAFIGIVLALSGIYAHRVVNSDEDGPSRLLTAGFWKVYFTIFYISLLSILSLTVITAVLIRTMDVTFGQYVCAVLAFYIVSIAIFIPPPDKNIDKVTDGKTSSDLEEQNTNVFVSLSSQYVEPINSTGSLLKRLLELPVTLIYLLFLIIALTPTVAHETTKMALSLLNIGGEREVQYYYLDKFKDDVPALIKVKANNDGKCGNYCLTKPLNLVLDLGGNIYVKLSDTSQTISLQKKYLNLVIDNCAKNKTEECIKSSEEKTTPEKNVSKAISS